MAVFFTLAIHCGQNDRAANEIAARFHDFTFDIVDDGKKEFIDCDSSAYRARQCWSEPAGSDLELQDWAMVCVNQEVGLGCARTRLVSQSNLQQIRNQLYARLRGSDNLSPACGFDYAHFGYESQDFLGDDDWPEIIGRFLKVDEPARGFEGIIICEPLVTNPRLRAHLDVFTPGYLWWDCHPEKYYG